MEKITIREAWVDNLNDTDLKILIGELNFPKIYAKQRVKGEGHHASPSALITRLEHALSCSS